MGRLRRTVRGDEWLRPQIGIFTRGDDGAFTGTIRTLAINIKATIRR